jgi:hypothetical protein
MYIPVKPIFKILYKPNVALQELEVSKKFTVFDSLIIYLILGTLNSWFYLTNALPWVSYQGIFAILLISFPLNILAVNSLNFSLTHMFKREINPNLVLFFMVSSQIVTAVFNLVYLVFGYVFGENPMLQLVILGLSSVILLLIILLGISELSGIKFVDSVMVYIFAWVVLMAVIVSALGSAIVPFIVMNLTYGRMV